jgi:enoyl-CoA hydratase/carnithine racemase
VLLRGADGVFSTGADMNNAYCWYGDEPLARRANSGDEPLARRANSGDERSREEQTAAGAKSRPSQRRRLTVDRKSFSFYHNLMGFPKVTVGEISGYALGGGFEIALMTDISVIARNTRIGMPATRFLGPALGSLHMFFHRLGPVLARRLLLTGDIIEAGAIEHLGVFTETCDAESVVARARYWAEKAAKMPADGVVIAKEAFRLVEQSQAYQGEEVASYLFHAFGTNLQFAPGEFNFVKTRAQVGTKEAFRLRDEHFHVPEPEA